MTDKTKGNKGISAFHRGRGPTRASPSASIEDKMGIRGSPTAELIFEDVHRAEADRLLGKQNGKGFKIAMHDSGRRPYRHRFSGSGHRRGRSG